VTSNTRQVVCIHANHEPVAIGGNTRGCIRTLRKKGEMGREARIAQVPEGFWPACADPVYSLLQCKEPAMATATLTTKGQITIPAEVRRALDVDAGDRVEFVQVANGRFELIAASRPITALKGMFGKPARRVSIEQMNAAIAAAGGKAR